MSQVAVDRVVLCQFFNSVGYDRRMQAESSAFCPARLDAYVHQSVNEIGVQDLFYFLRDLLWGEEKCDSFLKNLGAENNFEGMRLQLYGGKDVNFSYKNGSDAS